MSVNLNKALVKASEHGRIEAVKRLLGKGADSMADGSLALQAAAENGHLEIVKLLLPVSDPKADNSFALQAAAEYGHLQIVKLLLPVSEPKAGGHWTLQLASMNGHLEIVRLLLPVSDPKSGKSSALQAAAEYGHLQIVKLLLPFSDCSHMLKDPDFIQSPGCDLLLSCSPPARARKFMTVHPKANLPRTRTMLAAEDLRHRPVATTAAVKRLRA